MCHFLFFSLRHSPVKIAESMSVRQTEIIGNNTHIVVPISTTSLDDNSSSRCYFKSFFSFFSFFFLFSFFCTWKNIESSSFISCFSFSSLSSLSRPSQRVKTYIFVVNYTINQEIVISFSLLALLTSQSLFIA